MQKKWCLRLLQYVKKIRELDFRNSENKSSRCAAVKLDNFIHFGGKFFSIVIRRGKFGLQAKGCQRDKKTSKTCHISQLFIHQHCPTIWLNKNDLSDRLRLGH